MSRLARRAGAGALVIAAVFGMVTVTAPPASAHVDLAGSDPTDGTVLDLPVEQIELSFTEPARPAGDGVVILTDAETTVPTTVAQVDDTTLLVTPERPLSGGAFAVSWTVRAGDAHPRSGAITFSVSASGAAAPAGTPGAADPASETAAATGPSDPFAELGSAPDATTADRLGRISRWVGMLGGLVGVGALVFAGTVPVGTGREARLIGFWIRRGGLAVLVSLPLELLAQSALLHNGSLIEGAGLPAIASTLAGPFGWAMLLRAAGGAGLLWGIDLDAFGGRVSEPPSDLTSRSGGTALAERTERRLNPAGVPVAIAGSAALVVSFLFDGHTVTATPGWLVRLTDLVHVVAAAIWLGGVLMLAAVLTRRHRAGLPLQAGPMVLRFSSMATGALAAAGLAGSILAWTILDAPSELFTTTWGTVLIIKVVAVGVAAAFGAYNHFVLIPRLDEDEAGASEMVRRSVRIEAAVLSAVVAVTAILVGAAS